MSAGITGRTLASARRLAILRFLREAGEPALVTEVAQATGLHPNTAREHLDRLVASRFVESTAERRGTQGRPRLRYSIVRRRAAATADERFREAYLASAREGLDLPDQASPDGGAAGEVAGQLAALDLHLDDLGFAPEVAPADRAVHLHRCPYATLAHERTELLCEVHLDLARDVLAAEGGPVTAESLEPFVGPRHCVLHLDGF
ncbi:helix-turn-helix transcriptional regulator [Actinotalea fermentans]|uniref:Transcriptional regulator n=1 Tax=Actinotalea fermentans TaxID=43671 RepID=A0A511YUC0_9CELL|nr:helix-turn-helix domain-containing protein [Actinotalea fermentans]KGM15976.1 hypothetical protein N867_04160 [Actinotalea fermentans ATCC 43279 = JCM 9966 = DSM 3133]GEN78792.1 transcriptional regulator [Actinotalea fermentans]